MWRWSTGRVHQAGGVADALVALGAAVEHRLPGHGVLVLGHDQAALEVEPLELLPVDPQPDRRPARGAVAELALDRAAADERPVLAQRGAVLAQHPAEAELLGGEPLGVGEGVAGRGELDVDQGQPGLDPQHQQGVLAERAEALPVAGLDELVEDAERVVGLDEHLVAQVAGVAGAGDRDRGAADLGGREPEEGQVVDLGRQRGQDLARARPLDREHAVVRADVLDRDPEPSDQASRGSRGWGRPTVSSQSSSACRKSTPSSST